MPRANKEDLRAFCAIKQLPQDEQLEAASLAINLNPTNAPAIDKLPKVVEDCVDSPQFLAVLTTKYHGVDGVRLGVQFLDSPKQDLINRILSHMNAWGQWGNVKFEWSQSLGDVRVLRGPGGYWSYLGTDIYKVAKGQPTMNLEGFTMKTPEEEYRRVVRHEAGHTLGFPHEHFRKSIIDRLDEVKVIDYFRRYQGWSERTTRQQVLTPLNEAGLIATVTADDASIMCYRLPGSITKDGNAIPGGEDINDNDKLLVAKIYPKVVIPSDEAVLVFKVDPAKKTITAPPGWTLTG